MGDLLFGTPRDIPEGPSDLERQLFEDPSVGPLPDVFHLVMIEEGETYRIFVTVEYDYTTLLDPEGNPTIDFNSLAEVLELTSYGEATFDVIFRERQRYIDQWIMWLEGLRPATERTIESSETDVMVGNFHTPWGEVFRLTALAVTEVLYGTDVTLVTFEPIEIAPADESEEITLYLGQGWVDAILRFPTSGNTGKFPIRPLETTTGPDEPADLVSDRDSKPYCVMEIAICNARSRTTCVTEQVKCKQAEDHVALVYIGCIGLHLFPWFAGACMIGVYGVLRLKSHRCRNGAREICRQSRRECWEVQLAYCEVSQYCPAVGLP